MAAGPGGAWSCARAWPHPNSAAQPKNECRRAGNGQAPWTRAAHSRLKPRHTLAPHQPSASAASGRPSSLASSNSLPLKRRSSRRFLAATWTAPDSTRIVAEIDAGHVPHGSLLQGS